MNMYKKTYNLDGSVNPQTISKDDGAYLIPVDDKNSDYQEYLVWLNSGNTIGE